MDASRPDDRSGRGPLQFGGGRFTRFLQRFHPPTGMQMFESFDHTADIGLRIRAASLEALLAEAARGLFSLIVVNPDDVRAVDEIAVHLQADETDLLLFDWLNELLFVFESRRMLLTRFDVKLEDNRLSATARGELFDAERHELDHEVKAITYHGLKVERDADGWLAEVIVDI